MKYLIAPSAYKGFFSPSKVAQAIADGIRRCSADNIIYLAPIADGGDGTIEALHIASGGDLHTMAVKGPLNEPVTALWLTIKDHQIAAGKESTSISIETKTSVLSPPNKSGKKEETFKAGSLHDLVILELASACGLAHIAPDRLSSLDANTIGAGQLIAHCYKQGYRNMVLAVGGSASTDGGTGILTALGAKLLDEDGMRLEPGGRSLNEIRTIDLSALGQFQNMRLRVATDVTNPLIGEQGAAKIFAPQKGASPADVEVLEAGLLNYANVLEQTTGKSARQSFGAGAAGGVPFGLTLALDAEIIPGFQWITKIIKLEEHVKECDIIISAEGCLDSQSISGKASGELARMCLQHGKRLWIVAGQVEAGIDWKAHGVEQTIAAAPPNLYATLPDVTEATFQLCCLYE